jgi:hypothetical protein
MNDLVIPASRLKMLGQFAGGVVFAVLGVAMMLYPPKYGGFGRFIGLVTVAFFGAVAVSILYRLVKPAGAAIIINAPGITDNASGLSVGLIPWDQIEEVKEYRVKNQIFLGIFPKDLDALIKKQPRWNSNRA